MVHTPYTIHLSNNMFETMLKKKKRKNEEKNDFCNIVTKRDSFTYNKMKSKIDYYSNGNLTKTKFMT